MRTVIIVDRNERVQVSFVRGDTLITIMLYDKYSESEHDVVAWCHNGTLPE